MARVVRPPVVRGPAWLALRSLGVAVACLLALALGRPAAADGSTPSAHDSLREFLPTSKYEFQSEPKIERPTQVYLSVRSGSYLIRGTALGHPVLVRTSAGVVESVEEDALIDRPDGGFDLKADAKTKELGKFALKGSSLVIDVPDLKGRLVPPAPLLGWQKAANLVAHSPEYERDAKSYTVDADAIAALKAVKGPVRVFVYFGSWCPTCSTVMGKMLRVEQEVQNGMPAVKEGEDPPFQFDYYGLPPEPDTWNDKQIAGYDINILPTGLVYVAGKLCCRITGYEWMKPEGALRKVLQKN